MFSPKSATKRAGGGRKALLELEAFGVNVKLHSVILPTRHRPLGVNVKLHSVIIPTRHRPLGVNVKLHSVIISARHKPLESM